MKSKLWMVCCKPNNSVAFPINKFLLFYDGKTNWVLRTPRRFYPFPTKITYNGKYDFNNIDDTCKKCRYGLRNAVNKCNAILQFEEFTDE